MFVVTRFIGSGTHGCLEDRMNAVTTNGVYGRGERCYCGNSVGGSVFG